MPYNVDELEDLQFYQDIILADEIKYNINRTDIINNFIEEGSSDLIRDGSGNFLIFENPDTDGLYTDSYSKVTHSTIVEQMRDDDGINYIIKREFREM